MSRAPSPFDDMDDMPPAKLMKDEGDDDDVMIVKVVSPKPSASKDSAPASPSSARASTPPASSTSASASAAPAPSASSSSEDAYGWLNRDLPFEILAEQLAADPRMNTCSKPFGIFEDKMFHGGDTFPTAVLVRPMDRLIYLVAFCGQPTWNDGKRFKVKAHKGNRSDVCVHDPARGIPPMPQIDDWGWKFDGVDGEGAGLDFLIAWFFGLERKFEGFDVSGYDTSGFNTITRRKLLQYLVFLVVWTGRVACDSGYVLSQIEEILSRFTVQEMIEVLNTPGTRDFLAKAFEGGWKPFRFIERSKLIAWWCFPKPQTDVDLLVQCLLINCFGVLFCEGRPFSQCFEDLGERLATWKDAIYKCAATHNGYGLAGEISVTEEEIPELREEREMALMKYFGVTELVEFEMDEDE